MPPEALSKQLEDEGYALVPGVLEPEQVEELRSVLTRLFAEPSPYPGDIEHHGPVGCIRMDIFTRCPELRWLLVHEPLVRALRDALGEDFVYVPEMSAHADGYGKWHKDTSSQERDGLLFHWTPDFRVVQVALYLQDNDSLGGGLDVVPGSHRRPDRYVQAAKRTRLRRLKSKIWDVGWTPKRGAISIRSKAGDLVFFDLRLDHRATRPRGLRRPPVGPTKFAIYAVCGPNDRHTRAYRDYISSRPDYVYLRDHTYPTELMELAREHRMVLL